MSLFDQIPNIQFLLSDKSREEIRKELYEQFGDPSLLDLSQPPQSTYPYISISHTDGCSGWVAHESPIGFDIEKTDRDIRKEVLLRVSKDVEVESAPNLVALWVAKESAFKSLWRSESPTTVSQIEVTEWDCIKEGLYRYKFSNINSLGNKSHGWVEIQSCFTLGIALATP